MNLEAAEDLDITVEELQGVLAAIAPIVGTAKVASATGKIVRGLGLTVAIADDELAAKAQG
jgi:hypothetical protein